MSFLRVNGSIGPKNGIEGISTGRNSHEIIIPGKNLNAVQLYSSSYSKIISE